MLFYRLRMSLLEVSVCFFRQILCPDYIGCSIAHTLLHLERHRGNSFGLRANPFPVDLLPDPIVCARRSTSLVGVNLCRILAQFRIHSSPGQHCDSMARVQIYTSPMCPYCWLARLFLWRKGIAYEKKPIRMYLGFKLPTQNFREMVQHSNGDRRTPQILLDGKYFGDEDTLFELGRRGELESRFGTGHA